MLGSLFPWGWNAGEVQPNSGKWGIYSILGKGAGFDTPNYPIYTSSTMVSRALQIVLLLSVACLLAFQWSHLHGSARQHTPNDFSVEVAIEVEVDGDNCDTSCYAICEATPVWQVRCFRGCVESTFPVVEFFEGSSLHLRGPPLG